MPKNEHLLTTQQVAELLGVNVRTVHRLVRRGDLPHDIKVPGQTGPYMFDPEAVEVYRQRREAA